MRVCVVGAGYVGTVAAACLAELGHEVVALEVDRRKVERLEKGDPCIHEPGLARLMKRGLKAGRLEFTDDYRRASGVDLALICVNTPPREEGGYDLSPVESASRALCSLSPPPRCIAIKSTVPVGTAARVEEVVLAECGPGGPQVASNPEFLREGRAVEDFLNPTRIVIGVRSDEAACLLKALYRGVDAPIIVTTPETAELVKLAANAFLSTRISFINEIARLCERFGADVEVVAEAIGLDPRIGCHYLKAGIGFGGACLPKDLKFLISLGERVGEEVALLKGVERVNETQPLRAVSMLAKALGGLEGKVVAVLGLTFKPGTDDVRESPALKVARALLDGGARVRAHDPALVGRIADLLPGVAECRTPEEACQGADAMAVLTDWPEYKSLNLAALASKMRGRTLFDGRRLFKPHQARAAGLSYVAIGGGERSPHESRQG